MISLLQNNWPMVLASLLYLSQCYLSFRIGNMGIALAFLFYACANVGLILANQGR